MTSGLDAENFTAVYPAAYATSATGGSCAFRLPKSQNYEQDAQGRQIVKAPMMAYTTKTDNKLTFRNVGSVLAVKVNQVANGKERRVRRIEVEDLNGHMLWGEATCSWENGEPKLGALNNGSNRVALDIPYDLGSVNVEGGKTFYVALPPVENAKLKVKVIFVGDFEVQDQWGHIQSYTQYYKIEQYSESANSIARNKYIPLGITIGNASEGNLNVLEGEGTEGNPYLIESEVHLWALATNYASCYTGNKYFKQTADVVVDRPDLYKGIGGFYGRYQEDFSGVYDGGGKTITLGSVDHPNASGIFYIVKSNENARTVIKNLNAQVVIDCNYIVGGVAFLISGSADILNCKVMGLVKSENQINGGIVGEVENKSEGTINIENCTNMADVYKGGIVGRLDKGALSIKNCVNEGDVKVNYENFSGCGGIIGQCGRGFDDDSYFSLIVENCINKGTVDGRDRGRSYVGGILGCIDKTGDFDLKIINCCNLGHINNKNSSYSGMAGGIVGQLRYGGNVIIDRCINRGVIEGFDYSGGLCGSSDTDNNHPLYISNCMNWGSVNGHYNNVGGLFGAGSFVEIRNSCNMGDVKCDYHGGISGLIGEGGNVVLDNVYVGGTISRETSGNSYDILKDDYYVVGSGTIPSTFTITNVYIPESDNNVNSTTVKRYDANWNVVGTSPAKSLVDALNENGVTLPAGYTKESWVKLNNRIMLRYGLPSFPLPGTGNQNEQYGDMGNDVWE